MLNLLSCIVALVISAEPSNKLFMLVDENNIQLTEKQKNILQRVKGNKDTIAYSLAKIDETAIKPKPDSTGVPRTEISIPLVKEYKKFENCRVEKTREGTEIHFVDFIIQGGPHIPGRKSKVKTVFVFLGIGKNSQTYGHIVYHDKIFGIEPLADSIHIISEISPNDLPQEKEPLEEGLSEKVILQHVQSGAVGKAGIISEIEVNGNFKWTQVVGEKGQVVLRGKIPTAGLLKIAKSLKEVEGLPMEMGEADATLNPNPFYIHLGFKGKRVLILRPGTKVEDYLKKTKDENIKNFGRALQTIQRVMAESVVYE